MLCSHREVSFSLMPASDLVKTGIDGLRRHPLRRHPARERDRPHGVTRHPADDARPGVHLSWGAGVQRAGDRRHLRGVCGEARPRRSRRSAGISDSWRSRVDSGSSPARGGCFSRRFKNRTACCWPKRPAWRAQRILIDGLAGIARNDNGDPRELFHVLVEALHREGVTAMFALDAPAVRAAVGAMPEDFLADTIVRLGKERCGGRSSDRSRW